MDPTLVGLNGVATRFPLFRVFSQLAVVAMNLLSSNSNTDNKPQLPILPKVISSFPFLYCYQRSSIIYLTVFSSFPRFALLFPITTNAAHHRGAILVCLCGRASISALPLSSIYLDALLPQWSCSPTLFPVFPQTPTHFVHRGMCGPASPHSQIRANLLFLERTDETQFQGICCGFGDDQLDILFPYSKDITANPCNGE